MLEYYKIKLKTLHEIILVTTSFHPVRPLNRLNYQKNANIKLLLFTNKAHTVRLMNVPLSPTSSHHICLFKATSYNFFSLRPPIEKSIDQKYLH